MEIESSPLPEGWQLDFVKRADFDASFDALGTSDHFFVETMRGWIRTFQLRFDDAWEHFDRAYERALFAEETIPNLVRQFLLNIYTFENALLEAPVQRTETQLPDLWIPDLPEAVLDEYPEVRLVIFLRRLSEATLRLHLGEVEKADELFRDLVDDYPKAPPDHLAYIYLGLAASAINLGEESDGRRHLENAAFAVQAGTHTLGRGQHAATLHAIYRYLGETEEAASWEDFLHRLDCPEATRDALLGRTEIIRARCVHQSSVVLM